MSLGDAMPRRAAALIIHDGQVALIERRGSRRGALYYLFPGVGVEDGESPAEAAIREVVEETGLQITVERLVALGAYLGDRQFYFTAAIIGGSFGSGQGPEMVGPLDPDAGSYTPVWKPIADLARLPVYPPDVAALVARSATAGWPAAPVVVDRADPSPAGPSSARETRTEQPGQ
jgi:8-oxo-dGTP pyrophosphatase MutT (NUDIX family)